MAKKQPALEFEILRKPRVAKCKTCRFEDGAVAEWIHALLEQWAELGRDRPIIDDLYYTLTQKFPGYDVAVNTSSTLRNHLIRHEPLWERPGWR